MIGPKRSDENPEPVITAASIAEQSSVHLSQMKAPLDPAALASLRQFFALLAEWDEGHKGETKHE
jgi:hypothetical protein